MELRDLRAFVVVAHELHFARAAAQLHMSPPSVTELIQRLELELGTPLFTRTTRRITLTEAGSELLGRAETILDLAAQATEAVGAIARGEVGVVRLGITPPAGPVIAPHLARHFTAAGPELSVDIQRMWLPALGAALQAGTIDAALTCGDLGLTDLNVTTVEIGSEQLLIGLRASHPLAAEASIDLRQLEGQTLGMHPAHLFPAWHAVQRQILADANVSPPIAELDDLDLAAHRWTHQPELDWIMLINSFIADHESTVVRPALGHVVPFTLSWHTQPTIRPVVGRFIESSRSRELPEGWLRPPDDRPS
jgi:DNA-binding transcriptional LysR family regulator